MSGHTTDGRSFRILNVIDEYTRAVAGGVILGGIAGVLTGGAAAPAGVYVGSLLGSAAGTYAYEQVAAPVDSVENDIGSAIGSVF